MKTNRRFEFGFLEPGVSLGFGLWAPGHFSQMLTFPSLVPAFTIFTHKKYDHSTLLPFVKNFAIRNSNFALGSARFCFSPVGNSFVIGPSTFVIFSLYRSRNPHGTATFCTVPRNEIFLRSARWSRFSVLGASLCRPVTALLAPKMSTFPSRVPDLTLFNPFYLQATPNRKRSIHSTFQSAFKENPRSEIKIQKSLSVHCVTSSTAYRGSGGKKSELGDDRQDDGENLAAPGMGTSSLLRKIVA